MGFSLLVDSVYSFTALFDEFAKNCFPVIPAPDGLFMCEYSIESKRLEIRTFVDDLHLTHEQLVTKKMLCEIGGDFIQSPLSFLVVLTPSNIDNPDLLLNIISKRIKSHSDYSTLRNVFFHRAEDDAQRLAHKNTFGNLLNNLSVSVNDELDQLLIKFGVKKFQLEVKKSILKHSANQTNSTTARSCEGLLYK